MKIFVFSHPQDSYAGEIVAAAMVRSFTPSQVVRAGYEATGALPDSAVLINPRESDRPLLRKLAGDQLNERRGSKRPGRVGAELRGRSAQALGKMIGPRQTRAFHRSTPKLGRSGLGERPTTAMVFTRCKSALTRRGAVPA